MKRDPRLLPFYMGAIADGERLEVERLLLEEPDQLVDFFDLKRELEAASEVPQLPSDALWVRLSRQARRNPRAALLVAALAVAASLALGTFLLVNSRAKPGGTETRPVSESGILFGGGEPSTGGGVL